MRARNATSLFGLGDLAPAKKKALGIVYASSVALMMGVNFIQPALPALSSARRWRLRRVLPGSWS
ncbi:MAG: hypothetical protein HYS66_05100 [Deltaproteobacteria bacterium]|nr:hypothetical protein [Deltaproteobacteria bacterium]